MDSPFRVIGLCLISKRTHVVSYLLLFSISRPLLKACGCIMIHGLDGPDIYFPTFLILSLCYSLVDGKSKDLLTMKQNEEEWLEYENVMEDVVRRSKLDKSIFFDLRGNHDNFGVPVVGGSSDYFSRYSINGQLGRTTNINSVTLQVSYSLLLELV